MSEVELRWLRGYPVAESSFSPEGSVIVEPQPTCPPGTIDPPEGEDRLKDRLLLCPVQALRAYIAAPADIRLSDQLFLCYGGPSSLQAAIVSLGCGHHYPCI